MDFHSRLTRTCLVATVLAALPVAAAGARAAEPRVGQGVVKSGPAVASDLYAFGGGVDIRADVEGDLVAAGGRVVTAGRVEGNLIVAAGSVAIGGTVVRSVRGVAGAVTVSGHVERNLNAGGGTVVVAPEAVIDGRARLIGGEIRVAGTIANRLHAAGAVIVLAGEVQGDVELIGQDIEVLPTARINGTLTYWSPRDARIDHRAKIQGDVIHNLPELPRALTRSGTALVTVSRLLFMAGLIVTGVALYLLFPTFTVLASHTIGSDPVKSLGIGLLLVAGTPVIAILTMLTILGIPLGLLVFALYFAALLVGFLITAFYLGHVGARAFLREGRRSRSARVLWLILALAVLALANQVPFLGSPLMLAAVVLGLGATSVHLWRHWDSSGRPSR